MMSKYTLGEAASDIGQGIANIPLPPSEAFGLVGQVVLGLAAAYAVIMGLIRLHDIEQQRRKPRS